MLTQKLYKNGNSVAVTIPKEKKLASGVDHKFAQMVDEFINDHKDVLQELSHR